MTNCPKEYKNHGEEAFGEGRYVTAEMLKQFCKNDSYLKNETENLWLEVNPTSRKRLDPLPVDPNLSYGVTIPNEQDKVSRLSNSTEQTIHLDYNDLSLVDSNASTAVIESILSSDDKVIKRVTIPREKGKVKKDTRDYSPWAVPDEKGGFMDYSDLLCNEYWYVSYRKDIPYELRTTWLKNPLHGSIPGVSRAQTFKAKETGVLEAVTLNIRGPFNVGTPLIICIHDTVEQDGILYPKSNHDWSTGNPFLARQDVFFDHTDPEIYTIRFEHPCTVEQDKSYAIAVYSPTTHPSEAYSIGGWSQSCLAEPYKDGYAFVSENSGATWSRYGKIDETVPYHYGNQAPHDFAFICHIREHAGTDYIKDVDHYLYLKPIRCNPCKQITISELSTSGTKEAHHFGYEVSSNGSAWNKFNDKKTFTFSDNPTMIFVRIKLKTTDSNSAPYVETFGLTLRTDVALQGYARLPYYCPPRNNILGANVWGGLYAPYVSGANESITKCKVEVISNRTVNEHHKLIKPVDIKDYTHFPELKNYAEKIKEVKEEEVTEYLEDNPVIVNIFKEYHMYIIGFIKTIPLDNKAAYPMTSVTLNTRNEGNDIIKQYSEFYDYKVNYDENNLSFMVDNNLSPGELNIQYNPVIISGLKQEDFPFRLDYIQEEFTIGQSTLFNAEFPLKCAPNDPIYEVILNNNYELKEDIDFTIDYTNKKLILKDINDIGKVNYNIGDTIKITYTPHITDEGLSIGFSMTRTDSKYNIEAGLDSKGRCTYLEYKS